MFSLCGIMSGGMARDGECDKICILRLFSKKDIGGRKVEIKVELVMWLCCEGRVCIWRGLLIDLSIIVV